MYYVYLLHCQNNSLYTGYTSDLSRRFCEHVQGTVKSKYTRSFKPLSIAQSWKINADKSIAMKIERFIKALSKQQKLAIINSPNLLPHLLPQYQSIIECKL